jgi:PAS domain S-box-containing protein
VNEGFDNEHDRIEHEIVRVERSSDPFAAAVRTTRMPMLITDPNIHDNPIVFANNAFLRFTGYSRAEVIGRNCRFLQGEETDRGDVAKLRDAVERRVPVEVELINYKKGGERFWNRLLISPVFDITGQLTYFFASQFDVSLERDRLVRLQKEQRALETEHETCLDQLAQAESRLAFMSETGDFGTFVIDLRTHRLVASDRLKIQFGRDARDPMTYADLADTVLAEDRSRREESLSGAIAEGSEYRDVFRIRTADGSTRWIEMRGRPARTDSGEAMTIAGITRDVTEHKNEEETRLHLQAELNHRVKNTLATVQSIANQTLANAADLDEAGTTLNARIHSLARAHDVLTRENWQGASLREVIAGALSPQAPRSGRRFKFGGPEVELSPRQALALVMAIHELSTNAERYGALSVPGGRVFINWDVTMREGKRHFWLEWEEVGGPPVTEPSRQGFGSRMIEAALAAELGGTARIDYRPLGIVFTIDAVLPSPIPRQTRY